MNNNHVKKITEGALRCALVGVLLVLNLQFAYAIEDFFIILMPIPLIIYIIKYDFKSSLVVFFSCIILSFLLGSIKTVIYTIMSLILGLVYGNGLKKNNSSFHLILKSMVVTMILEFSVFVFMAKLFGIDPSVEINMTIEMLSKFTKFDAGLIKNLAVSIFLISTGLLAVNEALIVHMISLILVKRMKLMKREVKSVFEMKMKKPLAIVGFLTIILMYFIIFMPINDIIKTIIISIGMLFDIILIFYGFISIVYVYFMAYHKNYTFKILLICILFLPISMILLPILGFVYNITDFKSLVMEVLDGKK